MRLLGEIDESTKNKIVSIEEKDKVIINTSVELTPVEIQNIEDILTAHDGTPNSPLRVYRALSPNLNHLTSDFSILGFKKTSPRYDRGRKIEADYLSAVNDEIIVRKVFSDIRDQSTNRLTGLKVLFEWYAEDNTVGDSKEETVKSYNEWEAQTEERKRRERQRDFLIGEGVRANASAYIDILFSYFDKQIQAYIQTGSKSWADAITNHVPKFINDDPAQGPDASHIDTQVYGILEAKPENNLTIKEAILYQITGSQS